MGDYSQLVRMPTGQVAAWIDKEFPDGASGRWVYAMLDIAITDYYSVNEPSEITPSGRLRFAAALLDFVAERHQMPEIFIAEWYMKFAKIAIEERISDVPSSIAADSAIRYSLGCFELDKDAALAVADAPSSTREGAIETEPSRVPEGGRSDKRKVANIKLLLRKMEWFTDKISDPALKREVLSWLEVREYLWLVP